MRLTRAFFAAGSIVGERELFSLEVSSLLIVFDMAIALLQQALRRARSVHGHFESCSTLLSYIASIISLDGRRGLVEEYAAKTHSSTLHTRGLRRAPFPPLHVNPKTALTEPELSYFPIWNSLKGNLPETLFPGI